MALDYTSPIDGISMVQKLAREGKRYRAINTAQATTRIALTLIIPANEYIQIIGYSGSINEKGVTDGTATLKSIFGGTLSGGVASQAYNFNSLNPKFSDIDSNIVIETDAVVTTPDSEILIDQFGVVSTAAAASNQRYSSKDILIFGNPDTPLNLTLELESDVIVDFMGLLIDYILLDEFGNELS